MSSGEGPFDQTDSVDPVGSGAATETVVETGGARFARKAHRTLLYLYAGVAVVLLVCLIALVLANTGHVRVSWVFGASSVSLVWLVIFAALLGLLLGMVLGALFPLAPRAARLRDKLTPAPVQAGASGRTVGPSGGSHSAPGC